MKIRIASRGLAAVVLLCVLVSTASANTRQARVFFGRAEKSFAKKDYARALKLYQKAYAAKPLAGFYFNIGLCQRKLGHHAEAVTSFRTYLEQSKSARNKQRAEKLLNESQAIIAEAQAAAKPEEPPALVPAIKKPGESPPTNKPTRRRRLKPLYFWSAAAVTGALLLTGTITGAVALSKSSTFRDPSTAHSELQGLKDTGQALRTTSTVTFVLGAMGTAATAALFFFTDFGSKETKVAAAPTPDGAMLTLVGKF